LPDHFCGDPAEDGLGDAGMSVVTEDDESGVNAVGALEDGWGGRSGAKMNDGLACGGKVLKVIGVEFLVDDRSGLTFEVVHIVEVVLPEMGVGFVDDVDKV
jgi:hypothetical protein